jgi:hypothetical protein
MSRNFGFDSLLNPCSQIDYGNVKYKEYEFICYLYVSNALKIPESLMLLPLLTVTLKKRKQLPPNVMYKTTRFPLIPS